MEFIVVAIITRHCHHYKNSTHWISTTSFDWMWHTINKEKSVIVWVQHIGPWELLSDHNHSLSFAFSKEINFCELIRDTVNVINGLIVAVSSGSPALYHKQKTNGEIISVTRSLKNILIPKWRRFPEPNIIKKNAQILL